MRKILMLAIVVVLGANVAMADHIGIYNDATGASCYKVPPAFQPYTWYVIHKFSAGTTGSQWKIDDFTGQTQSGSAVQGGFLAIGGAYTGLSLAYGGCLTGDIVLVHLNYFGFPTPPTTCGALRVVRDPTAATVKHTTCAFVEVVATGGQAFNGDTACGGCNEVATEETTWGSVKALYR